MSLIHGGLKSSGEADDKMQVKTDGQVKEAPEDSPPPLPSYVSVPPALGYSVPTVPNGVTRIPSVGEAPSHPSTRHPSVASTRLPSVGEESTHPLLVADEAVRDSCDYFLQVCV